MDERSVSKITAAKVNIHNFIPSQSNWKHLIRVCVDHSALFHRSPSCCRGSSAVPDCSNKQRSKPARHCLNSHSQSCLLLSTPTSSLQLSTSNAVSKYSTLFYLFYSSKINYYRHSFCSRRVCGSNRYWGHWRGERSVRQVVQVVRGIYQGQSVRAAWHSFYGRVLVGH